jgi:hypothetical protein
MINFGSTIGAAVSQSKNSQVAALKLSCLADVTHFIEAHDATISGEKNCFQPNYFSKRTFSFVY